MKLFLLPDLLLVIPRCLLEPSAPEPRGRGRRRVHSRGDGDRGMPVATHGDMCRRIPWAMADHRFVDILRNSGSCNKVPGRDLLGGIMILQ
ncbi:hypothetical protein F4780DRAFT_730657 [Xylariomycetidae sp. FL0641]|nr:hypothetical protein F4780DRAFT_730657 [Xylariomycetidae sp. FL0641]